jgi:NNP family nitrate/nitrite transporter-like MFS transporter
MKLLPLFIFWCLWFFNFSTRTVFSPILPLMEDSLSLSHGEAGGFFTSLSVGYSLSLLLTGRFASIWGYKRIVVIGFMGIGIVFVVLQWVGTYSAFHLLFFLLGLATGTYLPTMLPILTETYDPKNWGKAIGIHDSAASFSLFSIPILIAFGLELLSWKSILLILGIVSLFFPVFFWKVSAEPKHEMFEHGIRYRDFLKRKPIYVMSLLWILSSASALGVYSILPLYLVKERGIDYYFANTLFGISRAGGMVVPIFIGFLLDRFGSRSILFWSLFTTGLSTMALSMASTLPIILVTLIFQSFLSLAFFPVGLSAVSKLTSLSERAMALGLIISIGMIFGIGGSPFLLGVIADHSSFQIGILGLGILTTLSSLSVKFLREI